MAIDFKAFKLKQFSSSTAYLYPVDGVHETNKVGIETYIINNIVKTRGDIVVYVRNTKECMRLSAMDLELDGETGSNLFQYRNGKSYNYKYFNFVPTDIAIDEWEARLLQRFNHTWFNLLRPKLISEQFKTVIKTINAERKTFNVFPEAQEVFRVFSENINNYRCVIVGNHPYPVGNHSNGLAFGTKQSSAPKSLMSIYEALGEPDNFDWTLESWHSKGILLLNASLTVSNNTKSDHNLLWKPFMEAVVNTLDDNCGNMVWLLLGEEAELFDNYLDYDASVIMAEHPATAVKEKRKWQHYECLDRLTKIVNQRFTIPFTLK